MEAVLWCRLTDVYMRVNGLKGRNKEEASIEIHRSE